MPVYSVTSPESGRTYQVNIDRDPTPEDVDSIWPQLDAHAAQQEANKPFFSLGDTLSGIGTALGGLPETATASYYRLTEGMKRPDQYSPEARAAFDAEQKFTQQVQQESQNRLMRGEASSTGESFRDAAPSLGFSGVTMGANILGRVVGRPVGAVVGGLVSAPSGPGAVGGAGIGGAIGETTAGMAASGFAAYRMAGNQFLDQAFQRIGEERAKRGEPWGEQEKAQAYNELLPLAQNTGLWEAGPEAVGNAVGLAAGKYVLGLGKKAATDLAETIWKKAGKKVAALAGGTLSELGTETITQVGGAPAQAQAEALALGNPNWQQEQGQYAGPGGTLKALADVAPATLAQSALMLGAGGAVKAGQTLINQKRNQGVGQPLSEAPAVAPDAVPESTGDLTAADVADLEPQPMPRREPILTGVPDRMARVRENALNTEPVMEGDVITDLRVPRSPEAIAESQRIENERLAQEAKLRAQEAKARGMPMVADSPTGSRDIVDWANENPIYLPPGFSAERKNAEYDALQRNPLPPYWRQFVASSKQGGNPDSIAQRAFDAGLIAEPTPDAYLQALQEGIAGRQQYRVQFAQRDKALAQEEKRVIDFEKSQNKLAKKEAQQVPFEDIVPGDQMTIDGEQAVVRNVEYNEDGYLTNVVIEDGKRFGLMQFDPQTRGGLLVDEFKPATKPFAPAATQDQPQTITGSNEQTGSAMPVPPPTAAAGAGAGGVTRTGTTATPRATAARTAPAASVSGGQGVASGGGAGASQTVAPAAGEVNLEDVNAELQLAGGFTNLDVSGRTAGFLNTEILAEARQLIADGFTTFANWSQAMVTRFGRGIREFLQGIWQQITSPQTNAAQNVRLGMPQGNAPVSIGAGGFVGGGQASNIPEGQDVTRSRFASPDEAVNLYDIQATETMRADSAAWLEANGIEAALAAMEANSPPEGLRIDHLPSLGALVITRLAKLAESGTEAQRIQADALLDRAGRAWHGKASQEAGRTLQQRAMATDELRGIAPILATKQVLVERADRVVKERFEGGAEGAVQQVKDIDTKASTQAGEELAAQLEGEPDAPELGDNPEVVPVNDSRVAELEKQMQDLREQMVREQTQAESTLAQTTSTWQKIMGVLQAAGGRKSSLLTGAKGKLAAMRKAALARKAARRAEGRLSANPVEDFADDAIIGAAILAEGLVEFTNWSQAIMREVGFRSGQDLRKLYAEASKKYLEALEAEKTAPTKAKGTPKQRAAREKINKAQRTAQNILDSLARRYSDPPIFAEGQRRVNAMRELYKERVKTGMPEAEFVKRAMALGANEGTAGILWEASKLEIDAREMMALEKSRAGLAGYLKKDSPALAKLLDALRKKVAPGMTWAEIFMTLPAEQKARQREIYRRLMLDNRLKALNQGERLLLTNELDRAWQRERRKVFVRELEKITGLGKTKKDNDKVKAALPRLLRLMNLGMLNSETFRGAIAQEYGIQQIDAATGAELRKLGEQIQQAPEGLPRRKLEQQLMQRLQNLAGSTLWQVLESWWTASVLSGWRTQVDIGLSLLNGVEDVGLGSIVTALRTGNKDVAVRGLGRLFARVPSAILEAVDHLFTGNKALMRNFELEAKQALEGGNRLASDVGAEMWRKGGWRKVPGGFMIFYGRIMTALDHITTASTREGALAMALARHPELYERALKISPQDRQAARNQARLELTGGDMPTTFQQRREENARVRELLERGIPQEVLGEATDMGRTAAMQGDPTGLGGGLLEAVNMAVGTVARKAESMSQREDLDKTSKNVLKLLQGLAPIMRAITGTKFARTVAHSLNRSLSYVPVVGIYAVGQRGRTGAFGDVLAAKQVIGTLVGLAMYLAFDDDEDEKGIEDGWKDKTPQEKAQLYAQGKQPYTVWSRNAKGQVVGFNYQQWGIAGIMNTVAAMLKQKNSEQGVLNVLVSSLAQGAMTFTDKAQLQGLQTVFGDNYRSTDPVTGVASNLNRWAAQTVGGLMPRVLKDIDVVTSPELRMSSEWWQKWAKEVPMLRQLSSGKRVDILGEDIKLDRGPLSRVMSIGTLDPAYRVLSQFNERDLYLPDPTQGVRMVLLADGTRRKMTELEKDRYQRTTGAAYRKFLTEQGSNLLRMPTEQARKTISKVTERLRAQAAYQAVRR